VKKAADQAMAAVYKLCSPRRASGARRPPAIAAFSNFGMKILVAGSGTGQGRAVNNKTRRSPT
jgi:hypothetical protein